MGSLAHIDFSDPMRLARGTDASSNAVQKAPAPGANTTSNVKDEEEDTILFHPYSKKLKRMISISDDNEDPIMCPQTSSKNAASDSVQVSAIASKSSRGMGDSPQIIKTTSQAVKGSASTVQATTTRSTAAPSARPVIDLTRSSSIAKRQSIIIKDTKRQKIFADFTKRAKEVQETQRRKHLNDEVATLEKGISTFNLLRAIELEIPKKKDEKIRKRDTLDRLNQQVVSLTRRRNTAQAEMKKISDALDSDEQYLAREKRKMRQTNGIPVALNKLGIEVRMTPAIF